MSIKKYAGDKIVGLSSDTKPSNVPDGATFYETDTKKVYVRDAGVWEEMNGSGGSPAGQIALWSTNSAPSGWLICDGTAVSRTTYADLFAVIADTYGVGDGSTTFNLPDLKGRVPVGRDVGQTEFDALAEVGGAKTHTLTTGEMPPHTHNVIASRNSGSPSLTIITYDTGRVNPALSQATSSEGSGDAHNNLQPYLVLNFIIKT